MTFGAVRRLDDDLVALFLVEERSPDRRGGRDHARLRVRVLRHDELIDDPLAALVLEVYGGSEADLPARDAIEIHEGDLTDPLLELADARLDETLPFLRGLVFRVFAEVAELAGPLDLLRQLGLQLAFELRDLVLEFLQDPFLHRAIVAEKHSGNSAHNSAMERITSRHNPIVKRFRELSRAHGPDRDAEVLLDGAHLVHEALAAGVTVEMAAFAERQMRAGETAGIADAVARGGGRVVRVSDQVLAAMSPVQHPSGVVAIGRAPVSRLDAVFAPAPQLIAVLAGVQDPGNVGAIVRAAAACGATGVIAIEGTANPFGWKALRGAMGGTFRLPVASRASLLDVVAAARERGVRLAAAVPRHGTPLPRANLRSPVAVLLGGEGAGITDTMLAAADEAITIPMRPPIESLNVAVAAALLFYEASRQRATAVTDEHG